MSARQQTILLDSRPLTYSVRRSRRARTMALHVNYRSGVEVVIPRWVSYAQAHRFVQEKQDWLRRRMARYWQTQAEIPVRDWHTINRIPLLGISLPLEVGIDRQRQRSVVRRHMSGVKVVLPSVETMRPALVQWYRREARDFFTTEVERLTAQAGLSYQKVVIGDQRTQWGSCSVRGRLSFNWRLLLAPRLVAAYVAAHEVAHLRHHNHSKQFWGLVRELCPEYQMARQWLRRYDHTLVL